MNSNKVFIVKQKWNEMSHFSRVKRVFFEEDNALKFINSEKLKDKNKGCFWVMSDREIVDYEPCLSNDDIRVIKLEAVQNYIESLVSSGVPKNFEEHQFFEEEWAKREQERLEIEDKN